MVGAHCGLAQSLPQVVAQPLGETACIHKDQRRLVLQDALLEDVVDLFPDIVGHHGTERRARDLDAQVELAAVPRVDDRAVRLPAQVEFGIADEKLRDELDGFLRCRQADALEGAADEVAQALDAQGEVGAAFATDHGVDFVDDEGACAGQHLAAARAREQQVQALGCRDEDVWGRARHGGAFARGCVARAYAGSNPVLLQAHVVEHPVDAVERAVQVAVDVVAQRLERGDVDDVCAVLEQAFEAELHEFVDGAEKCGEGLARARRRSDEGMLPCLDGWPRLPLYVRRLRESRLEPFTCSRMEVGEGHFLFCGLVDGEFREKGRVWKPAGAIRLG